MSDAAAVPAHSAPQTHHYIMHFPPHPARKDDPHYVDFNHYHQIHASQKQQSQQRLQLEIGDPHN